jgi:hypothetical protein
MAAMACTFVFPAAFGAARDLLGPPHLIATVLRVAPVPLSLAVGGTMAGMSLDAGRRGTAAIALAMFAAGLVQASVFGDLNRLTGRENPLVVVSVAVAAGLTAYGAAGVIAGAVLGLGWRKIGWTAAGFAAGGLLGSTAVIGLFFLRRTGAEGAADWLFGLAVLLGQAISIVWPFLIAGAALARISDPDGP